jgi:hypothetical protein
MSGIHSGVSFLLPKPGRYDKEHLWIVLTDPHGNPAEVVIVSLTTRRYGADPTVVLTLGDHPFIKNETVVYYPDARIVEEGNLVAILTLRRDALKDDCSPELLARIRQGLLDSPFTPNKIKNYCRARY